MAMGKSCTSTEEVRSTTKSLEMGGTAGSKKTGGSDLKVPKKGNKG